MKPKGDHPPLPQLDEFEFLMLSYVPTRESLRTCLSRVHGEASVEARVALRWLEDDDEERAREILDELLARGPRLDEPPPFEPRPR
jgi:hypothetical protein